jgi:predicted phosphodiesterase
MKILAISDTHTKHLKIPKEYLENKDGSISTIIHAGDISSRGYEYEVNDFLEWFSTLPFKNKIFIAGNHDFFFEKAHRLIIDEKLAKYPNITYLNDSGIEIDGLKIWGSPVQPVFFNWAFNRNEEEIQKHWDLIPIDTNILITHGGPRGFGPLNLTKRGEEVGCPSLSLKINELKNLKLFVQGHIHEAYGTHITEDGKCFVNASVLDLSYDMKHKPVLVDLDNLESIEYGYI